MADTTQDDIKYIGLDTIKDENINNDSRSNEENDNTYESDATETLKFFEDDFEIDKKNLNWCERYFSPIRGGSLRGSVITFASMCFGTAGLSLPVAMENVGLISGTIMFLGLTMLCYWSLYILLVSARAKKVMNYSKVIELYLGSKMSLVLDITNWFFCFGVLMVYLFTISSFSMDILNILFGINKEDKTARFIQMMTLMVFFQIPLGFLKNMSKLQYAGMVGVFVFIYTTIVIFIESFFYFKEGTDEGRKIELFKDLNWSFFETFSVFLYCYASHNGIFPIYSELKQPTKRRTFTVLKRAVLTQFVTFSIICYSGFFSLIKGNHSIFILRPDLKIFEGVDYFMFFAKFIYIFNLIASGAIVLNIIRTSVTGIFYKNKGQLPFKYDTALIITTFILANVLTFFVSNVVQIIGVVGGLCGTMMSFILPILCYVESTGLPKTHPKSLFYFSTMFIIAIIGLISTGKSLISLFK
jgi:amino acid permease